MSPALEITDRDTIGRRLLAASAKNSYDPDLDLDWAAPLVPGKAFITPERSSLYGTRRWDRLTPAERIELGKHELASVASVGLWFEIILMQMLARYVYGLDPRTEHAQYALTELGDETRHTIMFAKLASKLGTPRYGPVRVINRLARPYSMLAGGPSMFAAVLVAEETTDRLQREQMNDDRIQPLVRMVNRIHVVEESRHVRFARAELVRTVQNLSRRNLEWHRFWTAAVSVAVIDSLVHPTVYRSVGLDLHTARAAATQNPHYQATRRWMAEKIIAFLLDTGMIGGPSKVIWQQAGLLD